MIIFVEPGDIPATRLANEFIVEGGVWYDLDKGWRARADKPHTVGMQDHVHLYIRSNQIAVVNRDGTPSHNSDLSKLPTHVTRRLRTMNLMEGANFIITAGVNDFSVPTYILDQAYQSLDRAQRVRDFIRDASRKRQ